MRRDPQGRFVPAGAETGITRNQMIQELSRSTHGQLQAYVPTASRGAKEDPEFLSRLIAWNEKNGQIRDSKVALPVVFLSKESKDATLVENALAHVALLDPRNLIRALRFAREIKIVGNGLKLRRMVERYLRVREANWAWWERVSLQHRSSMKELYALSHTKPNAMAEMILFQGKPPAGTIFDKIKHLKDMTPLEAAGTIITGRIPFLVAIGALGSKAKDESLVMAMIDQMSPTELVTNTKMLERLGVKDRPVLRAAFEKGLEKASTSKKATFKTTRAAEAITDETLKAKMADLQEKQLKTIGGVDGNWLVLGDKSGSMERSIEVARHVAGTLAKMVQGQVHLVFFDVSPTYYPVSGKTYEEIKAVTSRITANGGTSVGCGLLSIMERNIEVDGIAIVSDAEENTGPLFAKVYAEYCRRIGKDVPVYLYKILRTKGQLRDLVQIYGAQVGHDTLTASMRAEGHDIQLFAIEADTDYYALPNLVKTMRTQRYSLSDEIMSTPLKTLDEVFS